MRIAPTIPRLALVAALAAAGLAACGGTDGTEAAVEATLVAAGTSADPADCERLFTQDFLDERSLEPGEAAVADCEQEALDDHDDVAESVKVTGIEVDGTRASARAAFTGGDLDRQKIEFALVEEGGRWKVDELVAFVHFDRDSMLETMTAEMVELAEETGDAKLAACLLGWIEGMDDAGLEAFVADPDQQALLEVVERCARHGGAGQTV